MKARIEKKLSKRLVEIAPIIFAEAWQESSDEPTELAYKQGSRVSGLMCVGVGLDYWGEGQDAYSCWEWWSGAFGYYGDFPCDEEGYPLQGYLRPIGTQLLKLAARAEKQLLADRAKRKRSLPCFNQ